MFDFRGGESLGESVGNHIIGRAIYEANFAVVDYPADEVETYVNMFGAGVILVVLGEGYCRLVVGKKGSGSVEWERTEHLTDQRMQPQRFFCSMSRSNVLTLCR